MSVEKCAKLERIAAERKRLQREADAAGEPFPAYLIQMAKVEVERRGA